MHSTKNSSIQPMDHVFHHGVIHSTNGSCIQLRIHPFNQWTMHSTKGSSIQAMDHAFNQGVIHSTNGPCIQPRDHGFNQRTIDSPFYQLVVYSTIQPKSMCSIKWYSNQPTGHIFHQRATYCTRGTWSKKW